MRAMIVTALLVSACATDVATTSRPLIDVAGEMCEAMTGLELQDGVCPSADLRCTPRWCCFEDMSFCCVIVDGQVVCG